MIGKIIRLGIFLVIGLVAYNYFFGDEAEKAQSRELVGKAANLGKDAWGLLKAEKAKMDEGKYDGALDKLGGLFSSLKETATKLRDSDALDRIGELDKQRKALEEQLNSTDEATREAAVEAVEELTKDTEAIMKRLDNKE